LWTIRRLTKLPTGSAETSRLEESRRYLSRKGLFCIRSSVFVSLPHSMNQPSAQHWFVRLHPVLDINSVGLQYQPVLKRFSILQCRLNNSIKISPAEMEAVHHSEPQDMHWRGLMSKASTRSVSCIYPAA